MSIHIPQNFYRQTIAQDWPTGTGNFYVSVKPTVSEGYMTISPASSTLREIVYFSGTGTDATGDYVTISSAAHRGIGETTDQTHIIGESVRMNVGAEVIQEISDDIDAIIAAGAPYATSSTTGLVYLPVFESTAAATHSLVTIAGQKVMVWASGQVDMGAGESPTITLAYNAVAKHAVQVNGDTNTADKQNFSLMYTETPGAATQNITVTQSGGTSLSNVVIMVLKMKQ